MKQTLLSKRRKQNKYRKNLPLLSLVRLWESETNQTVAFLDQWFSMIADFCKDENINPLNGESQHG